MTRESLPAIAGGAPIRSQPLAYGRHRMDGSDVEAVAAALRSGTLTGGAGVAAFEHALEARCHVRHAVAVANGSVALDLAVAALGVGPGDEVVTTPLTFVATANAVLRLGAIPVFADVFRCRNVLRVESVSFIPDQDRQSVIRFAYPANVNLP